MKNKFYILVVFFLLGCKLDIDKEKIYQNGNYSFRYLGNNSVCFCGWSKEAIDQSKGVLYVPEKIYNWNVVEVGLYYDCIFSSKSFEDVNLGKIKSIIAPSYIKTVRLAKYQHSYDEDYSFDTLNIPEGITEISDKALHYYGGEPNITLPKSLKKIGCDIIDYFSGVKTVIFHDQANWYVKVKNKDSTWQPIDVSDPSINAENLKKKAYIWEKRP
jgi:lipoprotein